MKLKPPADATDFQRKFIERSSDKIWAQIRQGAFDRGRIIRPSEEFHCSFI
ncbi:hypothetical protein [Siminovitchia terrae]|uniref:hypothetical protein n=1 Tax=Siminovitchia terrae TaxID=1914933 RepID=UPI00163B6ECA|nr:hypothetical protein [Siminovitchia terrae]